MLRKLAIFALAAAAAAQDLPPGVLLLSQIKRHIRQEMTHLPDYTCLETVQRATRGTGPHAALTPRDTVRVEVLFSGDKELYAPPGGAFSDTSITQYSSAGVIGDGVFAIDVINIFVKDAAIITYQGEQQLHGIHTVKYDFRIPQLVSGYTVTTVAGSGVVGEHGSFWVDPTTLELVGMETRADEIPFTLGVKSLSTTMDYGKMRIGDLDLTVTQTAAVTFVSENGDESYAQFDFTHCRAFHAESTIAFGDPDKTETPVANFAARPQSSGAVQQILPAGITIPIELSTPVDERTPVGTLISARVPARVEQKGKPAIPAGATLRGRVRRIQPDPDNPGSLRIELEFTDIEMPDGTTRFFADFRSVEGQDGILAAAGGDPSWPHDLPGVAALLVRGNAFTLKQGLRMIWRTRDLEESKR